jgi:hypothetical protein
MMMMISVGAVSRNPTNVHSFRRLNSLVLFMLFLLLLVRTNGAFSIRDVLVGRSGKRTTATSAGGGAGEELGKPT